MNATRRKEIAQLVTEFQALRDTIDNLKERVETIRDEENDYFDVMPEGLRAGDRGAAAEEAVGNLDQVIEGLPDTDELIGYLEEAAQ